MASMSMMFDGASAFNQPLGRWDVRRVESMNYMFSGAGSFNQPLHEWDIRNVTDNTRGMFEHATAYTPPAGRPL